MINSEIPSIGARILYLKTSQLLRRPRSDMDRDVMIEPGTSIEIELASNESIELLNFGPDLVDAMMSNRDEVLVLEVGAPGYTIVGGGKLTLLVHDPRRRHDLDETPPTDS